MFVCLSLFFPVSHGPLTCRHKSRVSASQSSREEITALLLLWVCQATQNMNSSVWLKCVDQGLIPLFFPLTHQVNGVTMHFFQSGYFLVSVDACSGKILKKTSFAKMDAKMEQHLKTGLQKRWKSTYWDNLWAIVSFFFILFTHATFRSKRIWRWDEKCFRKHEDQGAV